MKNLNHILSESLLDDDVTISDKFEKDIKLSKVYKSLTEPPYMSHSYIKSPSFSIDNIDFDKKGRIIFKNINHPLYIDFDHQDWPDEVKKYGFGDTDIDMCFYRYRCNEIFNPKKWYFYGKNKGILTIKESSVNLENLPTFNKIIFDSCYIHKLSKKIKHKPKGTKLVFQNMTMYNIATQILEDMFEDWGDQHVGGFEFLL